MPNQSPLLAFGAPLNSAFRSLGASIYAKPQGRMTTPEMVKPPELEDLQKKAFPNKELGALARYFQLLGSNQ